MTPFHSQFRICSDDGTRLPMTNDRYNRLPSHHKVAFSKTVEYLKVKTQTPGLFFCGAKPGICSSGHCPKARMK